MPAKLAVAPLWRRFAGYEIDSPAPHSARSAICREALMSATRLMFCVALIATPLGCMNRDCLHQEPCCLSCDAAEMRNACECSADETPAYLCPNRSACALAFYVGEDAATCCRGTCAASEVYQEDSGRCQGKDHYLHECSEDSVCWQTHRANLSGTRHIPWKQQHAGGSTLLTGIWGSGADDVWAVGRMGRILHWNGSDWQTVPSPTTDNLLAVWGSAADDIWAVGWNGLILHYDGKDWSTWSDSPTKEHLSDVWGRANDDVWAVGAAGVVLHFDGDAWNTQTVGHVDQSLSAIGGNANELIIVGQEGLILRHDGQKWRREQPPIAAHLLDVWVDDKTAWAAGAQGTLLQRTKEGWNQSPPIAGETLAALGASNDGIWVVGRLGSILLFADDSWTPITYFVTPPPPDLVSVWGQGSQVWAVGDRGIILEYDANDAS